MNQSKTLTEWCYWLHHHQCEHYLFSIGLCAKAKHLSTVVTYSQLSQADIRK